MLNSLTILSLALLPLLLLLLNRFSDGALHDWSQRRNVGKTEHLLIVPNAPRVQVGVSEAGCVEARPRVKIVRKRMVGMIARSWSRDQKDRRGRSSPLGRPLCPSRKADEGPCGSHLVDFL